MGFLDKIFGSKEELEYKTTLAKISNPLMDKIDGLGEKEVREFFKVISDAAERSLRGILFMAPEEFNFKKELTRDEIDFWLRKVSLALTAYSYYFFSGGEDVPLVQFSYDAYWQRMFNSYNKIFGENIAKSDIDHYAAGLKEDTEKGYSKSGNLEKALGLITNDYATIATELLEKTWHENIDKKTMDDLRKYKPGYGMENLDPRVKKIVFLGDRIWQAHRQIVQPFLPKLLTDY